MKRRADSDSTNPEHQSTNQSTKKKKSVNENDCQQTSSPSAMHQSINLLTSLIPDLFDHVCSFLSPRTKVSTFPVLSQSINQLFRPDFHCRNGTLLVYEDVFEVLEKEHENSIFRVVDAVAHIDFYYESGHLEASVNEKESIKQLFRDVDSDGDDDDDSESDEEDESETDEEDGLSLQENGSMVAFIETLAIAMTQPRLQSLKLSELVDGHIGGRAVVVAYLAKELLKFDKFVTLTKLQIDITKADDDSPLSWPNLVCFWYSCTLHTLQLSICDCEFDLGPECMITFESLPPSLTYVDIQFLKWGTSVFVEEGVVEEEFAPLFSDKYWLPRVRYLDLNMHHVLTPAMFTVMKETDLSRPYERLSLHLVDDTLYQSVSQASGHMMDYFQYLTELDLDQNWDDLGTFTQFCGMGSHLPLLKRFRLFCGPSNMPDGTGHRSPYDSSLF